MMLFKQKLNHVILLSALFLTSNPIHSSYKGSTQQTPLSFIASLTLSLTHFLPGYSLSVTWSHCTSVHCKTLSYILYSLEVLAEKMKNISRHCQMSPVRQKYHSPNGEPLIQRNLELIVVSSYHVLEFTFISRYFL